MVCSSGFFPDPSRAVMLTLLSGMFFLAACSSGEDEGCVDDTECARGTICQNSVCNAVPCVGSSLCPGELQACIDTGFCSAIECLTDDDCQRTGLGNKCVDRACFNACSSRLDCPDGLVCDSSTGQCGDPTGICGNDDQCLDGEVCDQEINRCVDGGMGEPDMGPAPTPDMTPDPSEGLGACEPCVNSSECGGADDECTIVGNNGESFCTSACGTDSDCSAGFECAQAIPNVSALQCLPTLNRCEGCLRASQECPEGQICDLNTLSCNTPKINCQPCMSDGECVEGGRCYLEGQVQVCGEPCQDNGDCGPNFNCVNRDGANVCVTSNQCGLIDDCNPPPTCEGDTPVLNDEFCTCVQCDEDGQCPQGQVCGSNFRCLEASDECTNGSDCSAPTPFCLGGFCVQCVSDVDCVNDPSGDRCFAGLCQPCDCPEGFVCDGRGECVEFSGCQSDAECVMGNTMGRCHDGGCYQPGVCGPSDTSFSSSCPNGLNCSPVAGGLVNACVGCASDQECRPGEFCEVDIIGDMMTLLCSGIDLP